MAPWLQWTPTSGPGEHLQLKTRLGILNHWGNGTAHIQGPSSHQLASRILELREALQQETRAPVPQSHFSQAPMAHLVGDCADHVATPDTPVPSPGPRPLSPASFSPGSSARFQQNTPASSRLSFRRSAILDLLLEGDTSKPQGFWLYRSCLLPLCFIIPWLWSSCLTLWIVWNRACRVLRRSPPRSPSFYARGVAAHTLFEEAAGAVSGA